MEKSDKEKEVIAQPPPSSSSSTASQEPSSAAVSAGAATPDWSGFQAYSSMQPHGYVASSPQPHPYMWGVQHMMPPYGTPSHPYVAMYPPGGMYAHPSLPPGSYPYSPYAMPSPNGIADASGNTGSGTEGDAKQSEGKEKLPIKRSKGSLGSLNMIIGKTNDTGKDSGASANNGACSKSAESASDGSSEGSDANSQNTALASDGLGETASENGGSAHGQPRNGSIVPVNQTSSIMPVSAATCVPGPPTNLNIGMDYWSGHGNVSTAVPGVVVDGSQPQPWLQDERELKRQKRKQSNRESARRSRLRKQAECDELAQRADVLNGENASLRAEINKLKSQYEVLLAENSSIKRCYSLCVLPKLGSCGGRVVTVKASGGGGEGDGEDDSKESFASIAPVELESHVGKLLDQILRTHPHLLNSTIDQQLEKLEAEKESLEAESSSSSQDILSKRISEVKDKDRRKALAEIIYCLVVHRFVERGISMIPRIKPTSDPAGRIDLWPNQEDKLQAIHSSEAFEMIQSHLSSVLGDRTAVGPLSSIVQISKIKLGKLYAASVMYGYFLRRIDQRYQLESTVKTLPKRAEKTRERFEEPSPPYPLWDPDSLIRIQPEEYDPDSYPAGRNQDEPLSSSYGLRSYVTYLDSDTLQRYATIRSKEAMSLIEKQTQALFGRPDIRILEDGKLDTSNDEVLSLSFSGLAMLVLEAVSFGSFLWDAESYVETKHHFLKA
ncbi:unnamed protein product [Cochlearia groenlandica]